MTTTKTRYRLVATSYQLREDFENLKLDAVTFNRMRSPDYANVKWAVRRLSFCLAKDGEWEYEPQPSSRDDAFYDRCRFASLEEALAAYDQAKGKR